MYQALYRKWRPQTFDEVVGQEHITETLKNQVKTGRLSHAYLFIGTRGTGKTTCARILAKAVNCEHPVNGNPCGHCPACQSISDGTALDLVELDAASNNSVDNVRALREEALFSPTTLRKRVYIIDEVHMLSLAAFNALLKILEEPPEHLMFILATTELQKVPATILSRCQRHSFRRIDASTLGGYVAEIGRREKMTVTQEAADLIARLAEGGVRDALSLLDQCSASERITIETVYSAMGLAGKRRMLEMLDLILRQDRAAVLKLFNAMWMDGKSPAGLLGELNGLLRDVLMLHVAPKGAGDLLSGGFEIGALQAFSKRMSTEELLCAMNTVQDSLGGMRDARNPKIAAELCLVSLCEAPAGESLFHLRARISRLEEQLRNREIPVRASAFDEASPAAEENRPVWNEPPEDEEFEDEAAPFCADAREEPDASDFPDPSAFAEEQPEDAMLERAPAAAPPAARTQLSDWAPIRALAEKYMGREVRSSLCDPSKVRGTLDGSVLTLEVAPGFLFNRFQNAENKKKLEAAAREATGQEIRILIRELSGEVRSKRDLEELRAFKEVRFM